MKKLIKQKNSLAQDQLLSLKDAVYINITYRVTILSEYEMLGGYCDK